MPREASQGTKQRAWYVTAAHSVYSEQADNLGRAPFPPVHLKRLGFPQTACGRPTHTWTTFWLQDARLTAGLCADCVERVRAAEGFE
jgi:hypothetical protein